MTRLKSESKVLYQKMWNIYMYIYIYMFMCVWRESACAHTVDFFRQNPVGIILENNYLEKGNLQPTYVKEQEL